jgi:hypothetical protein
MIPHEERRRAMALLDFWFGAPARGKPTSRATSGGAAMTRSMPRCATISPPITSVPRTADSGIG